MASSSSSASCVLSSLAPASFSVACTAIRQIGSSSAMIKVKHPGSVSGTLDPGVPPVPPAAGAAPAGSVGAAGAAGAGAAGAGVAAAPSPYSSAHHALTLAMHISTSFLPRGLGSVIWKIPWSSSKETCRTYEEQQTMNGTRFRAFSATSSCTFFAHCMPSIFGMRTSRSMIKGAPASAWRVSRISSAARPSSATCKFSWDIPALLMAGTVISLKTISSSA
mmetsp:Transcript_51493/g.159704  ORF Transcript_51493/g.159704 Transcript_51493/m.159704 type:complete len:221 (-) Transcript_51493:87-749(-)